MSNDAVPIPSAPGPAPMWGIGVAGNIFRYIRDPIRYLDRLFARYGNVASIVRGPTRIAHPGPGWAKGTLATAKGAGIVAVTGAENNREVLTQHERYQMIALTGRMYPTGNVPERVAVDSSGKLDRWLPGERDDLHPARRADRPNDHDHEPGAAGARGSRSPTPWRSTRPARSMSPMTVQAPAIPVR